VIAIHSISKSFGDTVALKDITFRVDPGDALCITGPSGSGKSTIVQLLLQSLTQDSGTIRVDGVNVTTLPPQILQMYRSQIGCVSSCLPLLDSRTVEENCAVPLHIHQKSRLSIQRRMKKMMDLLPIEHLLHRFPYELSSEEYVLCTLTRCLIADPKIILLDECLLPLTVDTQKNALKVIKGCHHRGATVIICTRDPAPYAPLLTRTLEIQHGTVVSDRDEAVHKDDFKIPPVLERDMHAQPQRKSIKVVKIGSL
jgi:ABC-type ATPase involved in cell division